MNRLLSLSLALAASALLLIGLLAGSRSASVHAQQGGAPTPTPATVPGPVFDIQSLPLEGKVSPPRYPNLDSNLNRVVEQARTGQLTTRAAAASAPKYHGQSVAVTLYIIEGYADTYSLLSRSQRCVPAQHRRRLHRGVHPRIPACGSVRAGRRAQRPNHHSATSGPGLCGERRRGGARCPLMACRRLSRAEASRLA